MKSLQPPEASAASAQPLGRDFRALPFLCGAALSLLVGVGCKSSDDKSAGKAEPGAAAASPSSKKAEPFSFSVPQGYVTLELRGEGSESLRVPSGARLEKKAGAFVLESGPDFSLVIKTGAPPLDQIRTELAAARVAFDAEDVLVVERQGGYAFVVLRELVPEWDESDRRRLSCSSAGFEAGPGATPRHFSHAAVEAMVAACLSLDLPKLE